MFDEFFDDEEKAAAAVAFPDAATSSAVIMTNALPSVASPQTVIGDNSDQAIDESSSFADAQPLVQVTPLRVTIDQTTEQKFKKPLRVKLRRDPVADKHTENPIEITFEPKPVPAPMRIEVSFPQPVVSSQTVARDLDQPPVQEEEEQLVCYDTPTLEVHLFQLMFVAVVETRISNYRFRPFLCTFL
jgi:hypothetical protein